MLRRSDPPGYTDPMTRCLAIAGAAALLLTAPARAGLYLSDERFADLPAQCRASLTAPRPLRPRPPPPSPPRPPNPLRDAYRAAADKLTQTAAQRALTADEAADLGGL